ncbi:queuine tRNA-ribosyltransferase accessory subunit 2 isoform X1 [Lepisosteus oculatus]|uniref:queuine tRNA-ribosyltransferase accessory subunit 2 isoform X1 n=1 Tax=Lepisosteus oculatus TaxID=7918 RepID=UPI0037161B6B
MKLDVSRVVQGCRLGVLSQLGRNGDRSVEVPGCLLSTRCGSVPHLTHDTLRTLDSLPAATQLTLASLAEHQEVLEELKEGARKFAGLHDTVLYCSLHDPAAPCPAGYVTNKTVSVWGSGGRIELTPSRFMALQAAVKPDWYHSMADGDTRQPGTSRKRARKAVDRSLAFLDECLQLHHRSEELSKAEILGVVEGGDILEERVRSARETAKRPVAGFVLDGFQPCAMSAGVRNALLLAVTAELPDDKPRLLQGVGRPDEVLDCVRAGVDLFEGFFPYEVTERGCALSFSYDFQPDPEREGTARQTVLERDGALKTEEEAGTREGDAEGRGPGSPFEMNLRDTRYREDLNPVRPGCSCYCCRTHSRAYVHHLLVTNELLAGVLLMLHNLHHYSRFFQALREALQVGRLDSLRWQVLQPCSSAPQGREEA